MRKYRSVLLAGAVLAALATATAFYVGVLRGDSSHPSPALEIISQVPAGAPTLVYIDLAAIRALLFTKTGQTTPP